MGCPRVTAVRPTGSGDHVEDQAELLAFRHHGVEHVEELGRKILLVVNAARRVIHFVGMRGENEDAPDVSLGHHFELARGFVPGPGRAENPPVHPQAGRKGHRRKLVRGSRGRHQHGPRGGQEKLAAIHGTPGSHSKWMPYPPPMLRASHRRYSRLATRVTCLPAISSVLVKTKTAGLPLRFFPMHTISSR